MQIIIVTIHIFIFLFSVKILLWSQLKPRILADNLRTDSHYTGYAAWQIPPE